MSRGYAGKLLEVDLTSGKISETKLPETVLRDYVGGRGLAARILWDRLGRKWESVDPLGPENVLLVLTGPLTGFYPGSKVCVSGKSPQSGGIIGSTVGGEFGVELKCAGYDGVVVTGRAEKPCYLFICDGHAELKDASRVWGKGGIETLKVLTKEGREELEKTLPKRGEVKEPAVLYIGPAGENKVRTAAVLAKWFHGAGYGGYGAVMGSKNLKAIVVKGTGPLPEVDDLPEVMELAEVVAKACLEDEAFRRWGTSLGAYQCAALASSEPIRNWQEEWCDEPRLAVENYERYWVKKSWSDFGCPTGCLKVAAVKSGRFKGAICDNPDYEFQAYVGPNLGVFDADAIIYLSYLINDLGLCAIQACNSMAFAAELFERGVLTEEDLGGLRLEWGDVEAFAKLAEMIAKREGIGDVLAEGTYRAALRIAKLKGVDVTKFAVHEKGVAIGAHGVRSGEDYTTEISYACSVQAGDHTSVAALPPAQGELRTIFHDSGVFCSFNTWRVSEDVIFAMYEAATGWAMSADEWYSEKALRILHIQRAALLLAGPDVRWRIPEDDDNPPRFYEPLHSGPYAGRAVNRFEFERKRREYYEAVGWDGRGVPRPEVLRGLGLHDVEAKLREVGLIS